MNIISMITNALTPDLINRIASALGLDRFTTQNAIGAAVPAILAGLAGVASQPGGAQKVADAVNQQSSSGILGSLASMVGGSGQSSLISQGTSLLSSLFGGRDTNALSGAVAKFAGMGQGESNSLLAMLAPAVMGVIGKSFGGRTPDASGITSLFASQKDNIISAMPSGFTSMLSGTGLFDTLKGALGGATRAATAAGQEGMRTAAYAGQNVGDAGRAAASAFGDAGRGAAHAIRESAMPNWLYWVIPLLALTALALFLFARPTDRGLRTASTVPNLVIDRVDVGKEIAGNIEGLRTALAGVHDVQSARAALPQLRHVATELDRIEDQVPRLDNQQRAYVAQLVGTDMPTLNQWFDDVLKIPGVADELKPTIDVLKKKLTALST